MDRLTESLQMILQWLNPVLAAMKVTEKEGGSLTAYGAVAGVVGAVVVGSWAIQLILWAVSKVASGGPATPKNTGAEWAVITGATDGIGKALAEECAKAKFSVCLVSRSSGKLQAQAKELEEKYGVHTDIIVMDFSETGNDKYEVVAEGIKALEENGGVGLLINNVGASYPSALYFHELPEDSVDHLIALNCVSVAKMTRMVLPGMLSRRKGAVVNISSMHGRIQAGTPLYALYAATKAYVEMFSKSLAAEYGPKGITIQSQAPGMVISKLSKLRDKHQNLTIITPKAYARSAMAVVFSGNDLVVPYWSHYVEDVLINSLPDFISRMVTNSMHQPIRARYLKKKEQEEPKEHKESNEDTPRRAGLRPRNK